MPDLVKMSLEGFPELAEKLNLAKMKALAAAKAAVAQEVATVTADAKATAPVLTGEGRAGIVGHTNALEGEIHDTVKHMILLEHGTYKDRAQPHMAPAAERSRVRFPAKTAALIKASLEGGVK